MHGKNLTLSQSTRKEISNYIPVSLLPIFGKVFEKILFNSIFEYLQENCPLFAGVPQGSV